MPPPPVIEFRWGRFLSILAAAVDAAVKRRDARGGAALDSRLLAEGPGWHVADVVCASGPRDRPFEERHDSYAIVIVASGTFRYRAGDGDELMTPGSLMLGCLGRCYECGHEHHTGDRCISFWYDDAYFERLAHDAGASSPASVFRRIRVPAVRELSPLVVRACAGISGASTVAWEELAIRLAAATVCVTSDRTISRAMVSPAARRAVAAVIDSIERRPGSTITLDGMARVCGLSPFHFLRTFEHVTGSTPHQFLMRSRLREAARRLATTHDRVIDIALDCGFGDPPHFTRAFKAEFGVNPRGFRNG